MATKTNPPRKPAQSPRVRRAPTGAVSAKPIALRLLPAELQKIKEISLVEQRSMASVCRLAMLRGLDEYQQSGRLS